MATLAVTPSPEKRAMPKLDPNSPDFHPDFDDRLFTNDILGNNAVCDLLNKLMINKTGEAIGLAFDGSAAATATTQGFEFRFYRGTTRSAGTPRPSAARISPSPTSISTSGRFRSGRCSCRIDRPRSPWARLRRASKTVGLAPAHRQPVPFFFNPPPRSELMFVTVAKTGSIAPGQGAVFTVGEHLVAVFHLGDGSYARDRRSLPAHGGVAGRRRPGRGRRDLPLARLAVSRDRRHLVRQPADQNPRVRGARRRRRDSGFESGGLGIQRLKAVGRGF